MTVSSRDRDYLKRLGRYQEEATDQEQLSLANRLAAGMNLWRQFGRKRSPRPGDPRPFYERARVLGLYRG